MISGMGITSELMILLDFELFGLLTMEADFTEVVLFKLVEFVVVVGVVFLVEEKAARYFAGCIM